MEYTELENLYTFSRDNDSTLMKHLEKGQALPSKAECQKLADEYGVELDVRVQVVNQENGKVSSVSLVLSVGSLTLFQPLASYTDEYKITPPEPEPEEELEEF